MLVIPVTQFAPRSAFGTVTLCRHGQTYLNLCEQRAKDAGESKIGRVPVRDREGGLTPLGERQSLSLGVHLGDIGGPPSLIVSSPLPRAQDSAMRAAIAIHNAGHPVEIVIHPSFFDRLTGERGGFVSTRAYLAQAGKKRKEYEKLGPLAKMYFAPDGGESNAVCIDRVRAACRDIETAYGGKHEDVLFMVHNSIVRALLAVYCGMSNAEFVDLCQEDVPNGSLCTLTRDEKTGLLKLRPCGDKRYSSPPLIGKDRFRELRRQVHRRCRKQKIAA